MILLSYCRHTFGAMFTVGLHVENFMNNEVANGPGQQVGGLHDGPAGSTRYDADQASH